MVVVVAADCGDGTGDSGDGDSVLMRVGRGGTMAIAG